MRLKWSGNDLTLGDQILYETPADVVGSIACPDDGKETDCNLLLIKWETIEVDVKKYIFLIFCIHEPNHNHNLIPIGN